MARWLILLMGLSLTAAFAAEPPLQSGPWQVALVAGDLTNPVALALDPAGRVYVAEGGLVMGNHAMPARVLRFEPDGRQTVLSTPQGQLTDLRVEGDRILAVVDGKLVEVVAQPAAAAHDHSMHQHGAPADQPATGHQHGAAPPAGTAPNVSHDAMGAMAAGRLVAATTAPDGTLYVLYSGATMQMGATSHAVPASGVLLRITSSTAPADHGAPAPAPQRPVAVMTTDFKFFPAEITVDPGQEVHLVLTNQGRAPHDIAFVLPDQEVSLPRDVRQGEAGTLVFTAPTTPGRYHFYCPVGDHHERGMFGYLVVRGEAGHAGHGSHGTAPPPPPAPAHDHGAHAH